ncbi:hypothetical protein ACJX0J_039611, partial [Zea mays]
MIFFLKISKILIYPCIAFIFVWNFVKNCNFEAHLEPQNGATTSYPKFKMSKTKMYPKNMFQFQIESGIFLLFLRFSYELARDETTVRD